SHNGTGQICLRCRPEMDGNHGVARSSPRKQRSSALHLDLQIRQLRFYKKKKHTVWCAFCFGGTGQI
ncbi:MAG: hypothetical protein J6Q53_08020, partial [Oscillospiraceae bacterium]|nr:hypothetical protein [Oscillospiraceae bacterium]